MTNNNHNNNSDSTSRIKPFNPELRDALKTYAQEHELNNTEIAQQLGCHATAVSKYINGRPEGNVARLEAIIGDVLKNAARRDLTQIRLFDTSVSRRVNSACETIRKTNDIALITGPAGIGKTSGILLYVRDNPATIFITITAWSCNHHGLEALLFASLSTKDYDGHTKRATYMVDKLRGSNRLIIIDNAHRLKKSALAWLFDFHDDTTCPIVLSGTPEVLAVIRKNDQMFSRIGLRCVVNKVAAEDKVVEHVVTQIAPEANGDLNDLGAIVLENQGHIRALRKQVVLAKDIKENNPNKIRDWPTAFKAAHGQLIRDYELDATNKR